MSALQSSLSNLPSTIMGRQHPVNTQRRRQRRTASRSSIQPNSGEVVAPPTVAKNWKVVEQAIAGDSNAQEQIFATHTARLYRTAFAILRNKEDAEDALQNSWCKAFTNLRSFEGRSSLSTWLTRIVINSALMIRRGKNVRPEASLDEILGTQPERLQHRIVDAGPNPEEICAIAELHGLVEEQIGQLPPGSRAAFQLSDLDGLSTADSIQALGIRKGAFKSRISRARQKVADGLQRSLQPSTSKVSVAGAI